MDILKTIEDIRSAFGTYDEPKTSNISVDDVRKWMCIEDLEVQGALWYFLTQSSNNDRIEPPLEFDEGFYFMLAYYEKCIIQHNRVGKREYSDSPYEAAWNVASDFTTYWEDNNVDRRYLDIWKKWLSNIYKSGDQYVKECLITGALEHIFENKNIVRYFEDWKQDEILSEAYEVALKWSSKSATHPFVNKLKNPPK